MVDLWAICQSNLNHAELSNSFFDEHYLQQPQVIAELAKILTPNKSPDKIALTEYWEAQFGSKSNCGLQEPLACFLGEFEEEVKSEPALKPLTDSRALEQLYEISATQKEIRDLLRATPLFETNSLHQQTRLDASSMNLYFHKNPPYNAVKMLYTGTEIAKDLDVRVVYQDPNDIEQIKVIEEFFPEDDSKMIWHHYKYDFLKMDQVVYFRLPRRKSVLDGRVIVSVSFVGANSGIPMKVEKIFELQQ